jgi:hypothetical protein
MRCVERAAARGRGLVALVPALLAGAAVAACVRTGGAGGAEGTCAGIACGGACPRDATVDANGRCACNRGEVLVLGACVPPPVADGYCGPAARATGDRDTCAFPVCASTQVVDVDTGCVSLASLARGGPTDCGPGAIVVAGRRAVCVAPDAACPPGTRAMRTAGTADGKNTEGTCEHPASCPPGALPAGGVCRPVVLRGAGGTGGERVVDLGAWTALVLGVDGGPGTADLCRPLQLHPAELGVAPGESLAVTLRIALEAPGQDVAAVHARVDARGGGTRGLAPLAWTLADRGLRALVELLRGLGGQTTTASVGVEVRCLVAMPTMPGPASGANPAQPTPDANGGRKPPETRTAPRP